MLTDTPLVDGPMPGATCLVTGKTQDGKSFYVWHEIFLPFPGPSLYFDPKGYDAYMVGPGVEVRYTLKEIQEKPANKILFRAKMGVDPAIFNTEAEKVLAYLVEWKRMYPGSPLLVVVDEAQRFMNKAGMSLGIDMIVQTCAGMGISCCIICPDKSQCPPQLFFQSPYVIFFTGHPTLYLYLEERLATHIPDIAKQHIMQKYHGICYDWESLYLIYPNGAMRPCPAEEVRTDADEDNKSERAPGDTDEPDDDAADSAAPDDGAPAADNADDGDGER